MITGVYHVGIGAVNFEKLLAFYRDVLGLRVRRFVDHPKVPGGKIAFMENAAGREVLELVGRPDPRPQRPDVRELGATGIYHVGFEVDDLAAEYERLKPLGVEFEHELHPPVPGQDWVLHFWDPEGNRVHLTQAAK